MTRRQPNHKGKSTKIPNGRTIRVKTIIKKPTIKRASNEIQKDANFAQKTTSKTKIINEQHLKR